MSIEVTVSGRKMGLGMGKVETKGEEDRKGTKKEGGEK